MSYRTYFNFSASLVGDTIVPKGTVDRIRKHIEHTATALQIKPFDTDAWTWDRHKNVKDEVLCSTVEEHNRFVRYLYEELEVWASTVVPDGETFTVAESKLLFPFLCTINVPLERWSEEYFIARMQAIYETMRGRPTDGVTFDAQALTPEQGNAVLTIFSEFMDKHDVRVAVMKGKDMVGSSYHGDWDWCEKCCASIDTDDCGCAKRGCPVRKEAKANGDFHT